MVSVVFLSYNRIRYIDKSVRSALEQKFSPLEIVFSDDSSTDGTYQVIQNAINAYKGPHKIILNRNQKNLGVVGNINKAVSLCSGDLIVQMGDDDISHPLRTATLYKKWKSITPSASLIFSNARIIDESGQFTGQRFIKIFSELNNKIEWFQIYNNHKVHFYEKAFEKNIYDSWILGATQAFTRDLYEIFGPINKDMVVEDRVIAMRALMRNGIQYVDEGLVDYRRHKYNFWPDHLDALQAKSIIRRELKNKKDTFNQVATDIACLKKQNIISQSRAKKTIYFCKHKAIEATLVEALTNETFTKDLKCLLKNTSIMASIKWIPYYLLRYVYSKTCSSLREQQQKLPKTYAVLKQIKNFYVQKTRNYK